MDMRESISALLADYQRLMTQQALLARVSENPIMNDLFAVINSQAHRVLVDGTLSTAQPSNGSSEHSLHPQSGFLHQQSKRPDAAPSGLQHASQPAGAAAQDPRESDELLPRASFLQPHGADVAVYRPSEGGLPLKPIPEHESQPAGSELGPSQDQRDLIHTPSQNSAEGPWLAKSWTRPILLALRVARLPHLLPSGPPTGHL